MASRRYLELRARLGILEHHEPDVGQLELDGVDDLHRDDVV